MAMKKATAKKKTTKKATKKPALANAWSAADVAFLKANYTKKTAREIANSLKRTVNAVRAKAATMNLKKGTVKKATAKKATAKKATKKGTKKATKK